MRSFLLALPLLLLPAGCISDREPAAPVPVATSACDTVEPAADRQMCRQAQADARRDNRLVYESNARGLPLDLCDQVQEGCEIRPQADECALHPERCVTRSTEPL